MNHYFSATELLSPPAERAAFSDRQAYVCAELSRLAYLKFEGGQNIDQVLKLARAFIKQDNQYTILEEALRSMLAKTANSRAASEATLRKILETNGQDFELVKTFSGQSTQAFICTKKIKTDAGTEKLVAYVVSRGTEARNFSDIKSDVKASPESVEIDGESVTFHSGYLNAFREIENDDLGAEKLSAVLEQIPYDQIFITGHSLGGALAVVTTRLLASAVNGACYTFGAPPVGDYSVQNKLKTPVYQIINKTDIVPRLPNPWLVAGTLVVFKALLYVLKLFTLTARYLANSSWDEKLQDYIKSLGSYRHPGYRSYLVGPRATARLRFNVNGFDLSKWWFEMMWQRRIMMFKIMVSEHAIDEYVDKLKTHALNRQ